MFASSTSAYTPWRRHLPCRVVLRELAHVFFFFQKLFMEPCPFCRTLDLALTQLALDSVLAISVVFLEILMGDAVATVPSGGQHVMRSRRMRFLWCLFGADRFVLQLIRYFPTRRPNSWHHPSCVSWKSANAIRHNMGDSRTRACEHADTTA